jgi:D-lactate dehydrogenase
MSDECKPVVSVFDTKPYDREYLGKTAGSDAIEWRYHDFRLEYETVAAAEGASAVCVFVNDVVDQKTISGLTKYGVKMVALRCAGFNNVDVTAAKEAGLVLTRVPNYSPYAVAEHAVALLLSLNRKIHRAYSRVREFNFSLSGLVGFDLHGKTAGIMGSGRTGRLVAQILRGFGMRVLAFDAYPDAAWASAHGVEYVAFDALVADSDVLFLHAPLTPQTDRIINAGTIAKMKPGVFIVNVSRGRLIHTAALLEGLKSGHVGGVALDVYEEEEGVFFEDLSGQVLLDDELARLLTFPNVLVTAHQAFLTHEALSEIARVTTENILAFAGGRPFVDKTAL